MPPGMRFKRTSIQPAANSPFFVKSATLFPLTDLRRLSKDTTLHEVLFFRGVIGVLTLNAALSWSRHTVAERLWKSSMVHRKKQPAYRRQRGATVGDGYIMKVVEACWANNGNPFKYLLAVNRNREAVEADLGSWKPLNCGEKFFETSPPRTPDRSGPFHGIFLELSPPQATSARLPKGHVVENENCCLAAGWTFLPSSTDG